MTTEKKLFSPISIGNLQLANRIVMAPMTRNRAGEGNVPHLLNVEYYTQRASAGLIITEGAQISPEGVGYPATPGIHSEEQIAGWKLVTDAVHKAGGKIFLQLWHVGRISHPSLQPEGVLPVSASAVKPEGDAFTYEGLQSFVTPRALELSEMSAVVSDYVKAAQNSMTAGFDGVEIHAANGYLIDQFLRDGSNHRTDAYGGSVENRARFLLEVAEAVANAIGADRTGIRISPTNSFNSMHDSEPLKTFTRVAELLAPHKLAYLHVVEGSITTQGMVHDELDYGAIRQAFNGLYIANGGFNCERAEAVIASGRADLVSFGSLFLANPDLVKRLRQGGPFNEPDQNTFYGGGAEGYTDYPALPS